LLRSWQPAAAMTAATQQHFAAGGGEKTRTSGWLANYK